MNYSSAEDWMQNFLKLLLSPRHQSSSANERIDDVRKPDIGVNGDGCH